MFDIPFIVNTIFVAAIGAFFGGVVTAWVTYFYQKKRDEVAWKHEKEKLITQFEHDKLLLEIQYRQNLEKIAKDADLEQRSRVRKELLRGMENPDKAIQDLASMSKRLTDINIKLGLERERKPEAVELGWSFFWRWKKLVPKDFKILFLTVLLMFLSSLLVIILLIAHVL